MDVQPSAGGGSRARDLGASCDQREGQTSGDYFVVPRGFWAQSANSRWHLYIADVDGSRLVTLVSIPEKATQAEIEAADAIVRSFDFKP